MDTKYEALFTPWKIGNVEIKNRIVMCPMGGTSLFGWMELTGCHFDQEAAQLFLARAKNNVGLIIPGIAPMVSLALKPPAANLSMPSAAWLAVIGNSAPSWPATSRIFCISSAVAPALTAAPVMVASKSIKVLPAATPTAVIAAAAGIIDSPMELTPRPIFCISRPNRRFIFAVCSIWRRIFRSGSVTRSVNRITTSMMLAIDYTSPSPAASLIFSRASSSSFCSCK